MLIITRNIKIPLSEFEFTYTRSGGAGGQNVNKVSSKAVLRWPLAASSSLPEDVRERFFEKYANRITRYGDLVLSSQKFRDQRRNVDDCLQKMKSMIASVVVPPAARKDTRPTSASKVRRREMKTRHSIKKHRRGRPKFDD